MVCIQMAVVFAFLSVLTVGCSDGGVDSVAVSGKVTLNGSPLEGVSVRFNPEAGGDGQFSQGITDSQGNYVLKDRRGREGVAPGKYAVTFSKLVRPDGSAITEESAAEEAIDPDSVGGEGVPKELLPPKYSDVTQAEHQVEVVGPDTFNFTLVTEESDK